MKKNIRVFLQYPWKFPDSPYYKYLIDTSPKGIEFVNTKKQKGAIINRKKFFISNQLKKLIRKAFNSLKVSLPNAHLTKSKEKYDLIHCAHCLSLNKDAPWIADFEGVWQMFVGEKTKTGKKKVRKILLTDNCRKIIAWTKASEKEILTEFPEIKNKIEVLYPAVPFLKNKKIKHKNITLLFVGRYFYAKGGMEALEAMNFLTNKYDNVKGIFVADTPKEVLDKYSKNKRIKFYNLVSKEKLFDEIYPASDIFLYPGYSDTFGFAILETMSFGIPTITVERFAKNELVGEDKGFVIRNSIASWRKDLPIFEDRKALLNELIEKTELLIKNKALLKKMSINCKDIVKNGKFSVDKRNKQLKKIYEDALK
jgi:glycosyltransferase involved in cell wall biosynthesis